MELTRRKILALGSGTLAFLGLPAFAKTTQEEIAALAGDAAIGEGAITLTAPEIAENGNTVPISVDAPGAAEITFFADGNPVPAVATVKFGPLSGSRSASTQSGCESDNRRLRRLSG